MDFALSLETVRSVGGASKIGGSVPSSILGSHSQNSSSCFSDELPVLLKIPYMNTKFCQCSFSFCSPNMYGMKSLPLLKLLLS